jgi:GAF domain-containing protein
MSQYLYWRRRVVDAVIDEFHRGNSLAQLDRDLRRVRGLSEDERAALWLLAWGEQQRRSPGSQAPDPKPAPAERAAPTHCFGSENPVIGTLRLAQRETGMDVAVLGEICDGREVVHSLAGDGGSFGMSPGASVPIEDTYCHRLLTGRLSNAVPDAQANEHVRELEITRAARIGAYIGVPLTGFDARLYVLCCLAHEQRPQLGGRDILFLRRLGEEILAGLEERRTTPG